MNRIARLAAVALAVGFGLSVLATAAQAGVSSVHEANLKLKALFQDVKDNGDPKKGRDTANSRDIASLCLGVTADKTDKIFAAVDCTTLETNLVLVDTAEPITVGPSIGCGFPIGPVEIETEKTSGGTTVTKSITAEMDYFLFCGNGTFIDAGLVTITDFKFDSDGICPRTFKGKGNGDGVASDGVETIDILVDNNSKLDGKTATSVAVPSGCPF